MQKESALEKDSGSSHEISQTRKRSKKCPLEAILLQEEKIGPPGKLDMNLSKEALEEFGPLPPREESRTKLESLLRITGTSNIDISKLIIGHTLGALEDSDIASKYNVLLQGLYEMNPVDVIEGMLCSQILALYSQGMDNLRRATKTTSLEHRESYTRWAMKLLRLQQETVEKLEKYRRKGQQTVQVEHVHVHQGAQAIVGTVTTGGRV
jgi:hypothetical protein